jgi:hypothetical protein
MPGCTLTEEVGVGVAEGKLLLPVYFASLSHTDDKHWQSVFIPLSAESEAGISLTWWARRSGLAGNTNIKIDTQGKWLGTLKSKVIGSDRYEINSIMCPTKAQLPARTRHLDGAETHPSWIPSYAVDEETVANGEGLSADDYYAGLLSASALIKDFLQAVSAREDILGKIEEFQSSPLTSFGAKDAHELRFLESLRKAIQSSLHAPLDDHGEIKKGKVAPTKAILVDTPATKEERYAGVWGAFG